MKIIFASIIFCFFIMGCGENSIKLNDKFSLTADNGNIYKTILVDSHGNAIISDSISTFWGKYPYLWGQAYDKKKKSYYFFLFNLDTGEIFTRNIRDIMKIKGLPCMRGYEQISLAEFYSSDHNVDQERIKMFIRQMQLQNQ